MYIRTDVIKPVCITILNSVETVDSSNITDNLELLCDKNILYISVTNREYFIKIKFDVNESSDFHATINAKLFLKLISQVTSELIEFTTDSTSLIIKANGSYKIPLIFDDDKLLELPVIVLHNITNSFNIDTAILNNIVKYNGRELNKSNFNYTRPVQRMYYLDEQGCITFTSGACVNNFSLPQPVKILFNQRLAKLFKLFNKIDTVQFNLGFDTISNNIMQTKVSFITDTIEIYAILSCDDSLVSSVPATAIRARATDIYDYSIFVNRLDLIQALNRLSLFENISVGFKPYIYFKFYDDVVEITDSSKENVECIYTANNSCVNGSYEMILDLFDVKSVVDIITDEFINIRFGNHSAVVISRNNIINVIPECQE